MKTLHELHLEAIKDIGDDWEDSLDKTVLTDYFDKKQAVSKSAEITLKFAIEKLESCLHAPSIRVGVVLEELQKQLKELEG
jgi:hypothetical protein